MIAGMTFLTPCVHAQNKDLNSMSIDALRDRANHDDKEADKIYKKKLNEKYKNKTVSEDIINEALIEVDQSYCTNGLNYFAEKINQCYMNYQKIDQSMNKCILEDLSLIIFYQKIVDYVQDKTGKIITREPFLTSQEILDREQKYFIPIYGNVKNTIVYFTPGMNIILDKMYQCADQIINRVQQQ